MICFAKSHVCLPDPQNPLYGLSTPLGGEMLLLSLEGREKFNPISLDAAEVEPLSRYNYLAAVCMQTEQFMKAEVAGKQTRGIG